jgi:hypothetical protein
MKKKTPQAPASTGKPSKEAVDKTVGDVLAGRSKPSANVSSDKQPIKKRLQAMKKAGCGTPAHGPG